MTIERSKCRCFLMLTFIMKSVSKTVFKLTIIIIIIVCRYNQVVAMTRFYKKPVLLIEFDPNKSFSLQVHVRVL